MTRLEGGRPALAASDRHGSGAGGTTITELARAKINLTLRVHGRRPDGYHELTSLVAFADIGDRLTFTPSPAQRVRLTGPFGSRIDGENLIARAFGLLAEIAPHLTLGSVTLDKQLPVAAGIGGGSADAAAALRAVRQSNPAVACEIDWHGLAARLGADVPVCLDSQACWMTGTGANLAPLPAPFPELAIVLVNPGVPVPEGKTGHVFRQLQAPAIEASITGGGPRILPQITARGEVLAAMAATGNDLEAAAAAVVPDIADVLQALHAVPDLTHARLSGAGPTCLAVAETRQQAEEAALTLSAAHPAWWVRACTLG